MYQDTVEDYQTPEGEVTLARKTDWITKLPKVFSLQMNRLKYVNNNAEKVLTPLNIEETIYADRFLIENKKEIEKIRSYV
jgi:uncharacterized UBP type Zn finger protein